jgi:hypothetical protein
MIEPRGGVGASNFVRGCASPKVTCSYRHARSSRGEISGFLITRQPFGLNPGHKQDLLAAQIPVLK